MQARNVHGRCRHLLPAACCRYNITRKHMEQLVESIQSLGYHYVLIDCPAGIDVGFINAISPAKEALIVTTPEITSIRWQAARAAQGRARRAQRRGQSLRRAAALPASPETRAAVQLLVPAGSKPMCC